MPLDRRLAALAHEQCDVLQVQQLRAVLTASEVREQLAARRWQSPCRGVVVLHNGPLTPAQRLHAAVLGAPPGSALGGLTAARVDGLTGFTTWIPEQQLHVVVPQGQHRPHLPEALGHWSSRLDERDVHPDRSPRRTRPARSLLDAAAWAPHERLARAVVIAGVQQRLVTPAQLEDALTRRHHCKHRAVVAESIGDARGGLHSVPERDFARLVARAGLPAPDHQVVLRHARGHYYLDAEWRTWRVAVEVHGSHHREQWEADLDRHNVITAAGRRVLHLTSYAVRHDELPVARLLRATLRSAGCPC